MAPLLIPLLLAFFAYTDAASPTIKPTLKPSTARPSAMPTQLPSLAPVMPDGFVPDYSKTQTWTYSRDSNSDCDGGTVPCGVNYWGNLYPTCTMNPDTSIQSPVDLGHALIDETITVFPVFNTVNDGCFTWTQLYNPNDLEIDLTQDGFSCTNNYITYENDNWVLTNIRFKSPSDHTIGGGYFDAEAQMYHTNSRTGRIAVVSVLLQADSAGLSGTNNTFLANIWANGGSTLSPIPGTLGVQSSVDLSPYIDFLPGTLGHYRYIGSLTEPPCTEDIYWFVYNDPIRISSFDLSFIRRIPGTISPNWLAANGDNNRPSQGQYSSIKVVYTDGLANGGALMSSSSTSSSAFNGVLAIAVTALILSILLFLMFIKLYGNEGRSYQRQSAVSTREVRNPMVDSEDDADNDV